jgi:hypothetical protein
MSKTVEPAVATSTESPVKITGNPARDWRFEELTKAGFPEKLADRMAGGKHEKWVDLHDLIALVKEKGLTPEAASDLLTPINTENCFDLFV